MWPLGFPSAFSRCLLHPVCPLRAVLCFVKQMDLRLLCFSPALGFYACFVFVFSPENLVPQGTARKMANVPKGLSLTVGILASNEQIPS